MDRPVLGFFFWGGSHGVEGKSRTQTTTAPPSRHAGPESMLSLSTGEV